MNTAERQKIYTLLAQYFPNAKQLKDKTTLTAWGLALERFPYADVKTAVVNYAITNKFFPDLADITAGLTPEQQAEPPTRAVPPASSSMHLQAQWVRLYNDMLADELRSRGLPEFTGITGAERNKWIETCRQAGLDIHAVCEAAYRIVYGRKEVAT